MINKVFYFALSAMVSTTFMPTKAVATDYNDISNTLRVSTQFILPHLDLQSIKAWRQTSKSMQNQVKEAFLGENPPLYTHWANPNSPDKVDNFSIFMIPKLVKNIGDGVPLSAGRLFFSLDAAQLFSLVLSSEITESKVTILAYDTFSKGIGIDGYKNTYKNFDQIILNNFLKTAISQVHVKNEDYQLLSQDRKENYQGFCASAFLKSFDSFTQFERNLSRLDLKKAKTFISIIGEEFLWDSFSDSIRQNWQIEKKELKRAVVTLASVFDVQKDSESLKALDEAVATVTGQPNYASSIRQKILRAIFIKGYCTEGEDYVI